MLTIRDTQFKQMAQASIGRQMVQPCDYGKTWVEICLVDENGAPVPNQRYRVQLPDSSIMEGNLNSEGKVRAESIIPGTCQVSFPDIHSDEWRPA